MSEDLEVTPAEASQLESTSESDEELLDESVYNPFDTNKVVKVANSTDHYVWIGLQGDTEISKGGQKYNIDLAGTFGAGFETATKEHGLISRVPWKRAQFHSLTTIRYSSEIIVEGTARVLVWCPQVKGPMKQLMIMEESVINGDSVILAQEGTTKFATTEKIKPIGFDKIPLSKRANKALYKTEEARQKNWVPKDEYGDIKDIIMDPHIQRGINPKDCELCQVIFERDPCIAKDRERVKELEEKTQNLTDAGAASDAPIFDEDVIVEEIEQKLQL